MHRGDHWWLLQERERERNTGPWTHPHSWSNPLQFPLTLCIAWVSGSPFIRSCSSHGGGGLTKTSLGLLESHGAFPESNCRSRRGRHNIQKEQVVRRWEVWRTHQESGRDGRERNCMVVWRCSGARGKSFSKIGETSCAWTKGRAPEEKWRAKARVKKEWAAVSFGLALKGKQSTLETGLTEEDPGAVILRRKELLQSMQPHSSL